MNRRNFLDRTMVYASGALLMPSFLAAADEKKPEKPPAVVPDLVRDFVIAGHGDLDKVKTMLTENPNLLYACWDWGGGDFETALEGAGHMGRADIATHLIAQGARPNIYVLTMLGQTAIVKGILDAYPNLLTSRGPHGLSLLHHATKGGEASAELLEYLKSKGLTDMKYSLY